MASYIVSLACSIDSVTILVGALRGNAMSLKFQLVQAVMFVPFGSQAVGEQVDHGIVFGGNRTVQPGIAFLVDSLDGFQVKQGVDPATAVFFQDAHQFEGNDVDLADEAPGFEPA